MTVTVPTDPAHRSAEEIGRTALGPRPLPPLGATREVPLPDVLDVTLANGPAGARRARGPGVPMAELRLRVPFAPDATEADDAAVSRHLAAAELLSATLLTGTADPRPRRDRRRAGRRGRGPGRRPSIPSGCRSAAPGSPPGCRRSSTCSRTSSPPRRTRTPRCCASASGSSSGSPSPAPSRARSPGRRCSASGSATTRSPGRCRPARTWPRSSPPTSAPCRRRPRAGRRDPHPRRRPRPGRRGRAHRAVPRRLDGPASCASADRAAARGGRRTWSSCHRAGSVQSQLRLSAPALPRLDARYAALQLANLVFGGYFSSRWMENIREDKGYTYGAHSGTEFVPGGAVLSVETDVASDVTAAALLETRYELGRMTAVPPTADEIDAARRYAVGSLLISLDSQGGFGSTLATLAADDVPVQWLRDHPARLEAVTVDEVAAAARRVLRAERVHRRDRRRRGRRRAAACAPWRRSTCRDPARLGSEVWSAADQWTRRRERRARPAAGGALRPARAAGAVALGRAARRDAALRHRPAVRGMARRRGSWSSTPAGRVPVEWTGRAPEGPWAMDTDGTARLVTMPTTGDARRTDAVLLGEADGIAYWAVRDPTELVPGEDPVDRADLRTAGAALDALGAGLLTTAVAVLNWHDAARFCGRDGSPTHPAGGGLAPGLRGARPRGLPAHRPRGHLPGARRRGPACCSPASPSGRRAGSRCSRGSSRRGSRWRPACCGRSTRRSGSRSATSPTSAARPGRSRGRSWSASRRSRTRTRRCARPRGRSPRRCG